MKTYGLIFTFWLAPIFLSIAYSQVHVDVDEDVGIGTTATENSKMKVENTTNIKGLQIQSNFVHSDTVFGMHNTLSSGGMGSKVGFNNEIWQNSATSSPSATWAQRNILHPGGTTAAICLSNQIVGEGTGSKLGLVADITQNATSAAPILGYLGLQQNFGTGANYGIMQSLYGGDGQKQAFKVSIFQSPGATGEVNGFNSYLSNLGSAKTIGLESIIIEPGTGEKIGFKNNVTENASSIGTTYGIYNEAILKGVQAGYGIWNKVVDDVNSDGTKYGIYNYLEDKTTNATTKYGIYNYVEQQGAGTNYGIWSGVEGEGDYAGYFSGNVMVTGTMIDGTSDARLKEKTQKIQGALGIISRLQPKSYFFKNDMGLQLPKGRQYGLIAQELEEVMPDLVSDYEHPGQPIYKKVSVNEKPVFPKELRGLIKVKNDEKKSMPLALAEQQMAAQSSTKIVGYEADQSYKAINYQALIPLLVAAVQEQQAQAQEWQKEVQELRAEVARLSKAVNDK